MFVCLGDYIYSGSSAFNFSIRGAPIAHIYIRPRRFSHFLQRHDYGTCPSKSKFTFPNIYDFVDIYKYIYVY